MIQYDGKYKYIHIYIPSYFEYHLVNFEYSTACVSIRGLTTKDTHDSLDCLKWVVPEKLKHGVIKLCHGIVWPWKNFLKEAVMVTNLSLGFVEEAINLISYSIINR